METKKESGIHSIDGGNIEVVFGGRICPSVLRSKVDTGIVSVRLSELSKLYNVGDAFKSNEYKNLDNNTVWLTFDNIKSIDSVIASLNMAKDMLLNASHKELLEKYPMFQPKNNFVNVNCKLKSSDDLFNAISSTKNYAEYAVLTSILMHLSMKHPVNKVLDGVDESDLIDVLTEMVQTNENALKIINKQLENDMLTDWDINMYTTEKDLLESRLDILSKYITL